MKNDFKLFNLAQLGQDYMALYTQAYNEAKLSNETLAKRVWEKKVAQATKSIAHLFDGEAGSDGIEEMAVEHVGEFKVPPVDTKPLKVMAREAAVEDWVKQNSINQKLTWFGPQMLAYFGTWKAIKVGDKYCPKATIHHNVIGPKDYFALGSVLLAQSPRSVFFKDAPRGTQQYKNTLSPLVPIILGGFKKYQNIPYMEWDLSLVDEFENSDICSILGSEIPDISVAELLAIRNAALTPSTGPRAGKLSNPATSASLYKVPESAIGHLPRLVRFMAIQTWCAHPSNRTEYMILDPKDWDRMPEPLAHDTLFTPAPSLVTHRVDTVSADELPWL